MNKKRMMDVAIGAAGVILGSKLLKSNSVKKMAVNAVASGLKAKGYVDKTIEKARENAEDIYAEAEVAVKAEEDRERQEIVESEREDDEE